MRAGCIDIGSNTTRLLIAELDHGRLREVHQERVFTRVGQGLGAGAAIPRAKIDEVAEVVAAQLASARAHGVAAPRAVATAAIRTAANGEALIDAVRRASGLRVELLSGEQEARLAFIGAATLLDEPPDGPLGVLDVGGGSSELVVGDAPGRVRWWTSLAVGSSTITDGCLHDDPPTGAQVAAARRHLATALEGVRPPRPTLAVAVGGSATSLCRIAGPVLEPAALRRALEALTVEPAAAVARRWQVDAQRARLLPAGLLILEAMAGLVQTTITVGHGGIREGVVLEALGR